MIDPPLHTSIFGLKVLRGCILAHYLGSRQIWIRKQKDSGMIDALHIPCEGGKTTRNRSILYCNPNAGFYEVATRMSLIGGGNFRIRVSKDGKPSSATALETCWTDFYLENGFDVYLFNYPGYGQSHGLGMFG